VAISKGDVPQHHWFHLRTTRDEHQRPGDAPVVGGNDVRVTMPLLLMRTFPVRCWIRVPTRASRASAKVRSAASGAVGYLRVGLRLHRPRWQLSSTGRSAFRLGLKRGLENDLGDRAIRDWRWRR
jgi:hypothetical protein